MIGRKRTRGSQKWKRERKQSAGEIMESTQPRNNEPDADTSDENDQIIYYTYIHQKYRRYMSCKDEARQ